MRGGKRQGAGRKKLPGELRQRPLQIKVAAYLADKFERDAALVGLTRGEYLETLMTVRESP